MTISLHLLLFGILCVLSSSEAQRPCAISLDIGGDNCSEENLCTIIQGFDECTRRQQTECEQTQWTTCSLQIHNSTLSGENNTNIIFSEPSMIDSFSIFFAGEVLVNEGFFIHVINDAFSELTIASSAMRIIGATETAILFESSNNASSLTLKDITFQNCVTEDGTVPALHIDSPGFVELSDLIFQGTSTNGNCGAFLLQLYETTNIVGGNYGNFFNTSASGYGGAFCIFGSPGVDYSPPQFTAIASQALYGGGLYIRGPGSFHIRGLVNTYKTLATNGSLIYAEDFDSMLFIESSYVVIGFNSGTFIQPTVDNGEIYLSSSVVGASVTVERLVTSAADVEGNGGAFYFRDIDTVTVSRSFFGGCYANNGIGGALLFDGVGDINLFSTEFDQNYAQTGAAMACIGGGLSVNASDVQFISSFTTSLYSDDSDIDVYTDGSCTDEFWTSEYSCPKPFSCSSCGSSVCGIATTRCSCYCDADTCEEPSSSPSPSPSPSAATNYVNVSRYSSETGSSLVSGSAWIIIIVIASVLVFLLVVLVTVVGLLYGKKYLSTVQLPIPSPIKAYEKIDTKSPDTPQRESDGLYQVTEIDAE